MRDRGAVDSFAFARDAGELRGTLTIVDLPRLHDALFDQSGEITYDLAGAVNKDGIASLRLELAAELLNLPTLPRSGKIQPEVDAQFRTGSRDGGAR